MNMTSSTARNTPYEATTQPAASQPALAAAPRPPTPSSSSPRYITWLLRADIASNAARTSRSVSRRTRKAVHIDTPWVTRNRTTPST